MAKPKHGRSNNHAGLISLSFSSDAHPTPPSPDPHSHPRTRARTRPRPRFHHSHPPRFPSPAVLSALALVATTPAVAGGPLPTPTSPPTFLCPSIERHDVDLSSHTSLSLAPRAAVLSSSAPLLTPSPSSQYVSPGAVADKYVQGSDSLWRKTNAWILFGSTCCSTSTVPASSTQAQPSSLQSPPPTPTSTTVQFDTSVLPAGWNSTSNLSSTTESTIILALAIVLAGSICVFMIVCVIWRKRKKRTRDIERKLARKPGADDDSQDNAQEKDARGKTQMWARASARWKSNVRQLARRRRKRLMVSSSNRPLSPIFSDSPQGPAAAPSVLSRRGSFVPQDPDTCRPDAVPRLHGDVTEPPTVLHDAPRSSSPPTYGASLVSGFSRLPPSSTVSNPSPDSPHAVQRDDQPCCTEDEPLPYIPPRDGHVATDDKAQLAHIRELASSPPTMGDAASARTVQSVSAPEWNEVEDDLEDLGIDLSGGSMSLRNFGLPPSFPLPPSKADVPFDHLDDHPLRFGQADDIPFDSSVLGPSGPCSSAPPIDDPGLEPSAPSLEGEDDLFQDWDGTSSYVSEALTSADPGSPVRLVELSVAPTESSTLRASSPCIQDSAARDGMLPQYHP